MLNKIQVARNCLNPFQKIIEIHVLKLHWQRIHLININKADLFASIKNCASALPAASLLAFFAAFRISRLSTCYPSDPFSFPFSRTEKEVINIATAFRSWPSKGTKLCPRMGGVTPNPQSQNGSLRRPLFPSRGNSESFVTLLPG